jgi:two-component system, OmpR family, sensor histidine kinase BaeS
MKPRLSFRSRLLAGHLLPVVLLAVLAALALIYMLQNRLIVPTLANGMIAQGLLVERLTRDRPQVWTSPAEAQALLDSIDLRPPTRIGLLTPDHILLAASQPDDRPRVGQAVPNLPDSNTLVDPWWAITPGDLTGGQILDAIIPVKQADGQTLGLIQLYQRMADIEPVYTTLRLWVVGVLLVGLLIAGLAAGLLSESASLRLKRFSQKIAESRLEGQAPGLPEEGKGEFSDLSHAFNRLQERRRELEETRQQMLANLIHEIGRPLGSIRTALHALQAGAVNDLSLRTELMNGMSERVDRMGRLLEDLALTYRKLEPQDIQLKSLQVNEWMDSLTPLWAESARQKGLVWEVSLPDDLPIIQTDPDRLAQALSNLVSNAIKFTASGGQIVLTVCLHEGKMQFQIRDTGTGIPLADQPHLFVPFYRSVRPSWRAPGLGLGLSITKSIIESLGGQITLVSAPSQGSTFTITLPMP